MQTFRFLYKKYWFRKTERESEKMRDEWEKKFRGREIKIYRTKILFIHRKTYCFRESESSKEREIERQRHNLRYQGPLETYIGLVLHKNIYCESRSIKLFHKTGKLSRQKKLMENLNLSSRKNLFSVSALKESENVQLARRKEKRNKDREKVKNTNN